MIRRSRRTTLRVLALALFITAGVVGLMPEPGSAAEPAQVGWWHRDIPLSDTPATGQAASTPVPARISGSAAPGQVLPPPPTLPPPPVPPPTLPPVVTIPDPGTDVPTPIPVPDGGLIVANDPTGPQAMAALRFDGTDAGGAILTLKIAGGSTPNINVRACPALSEWLAGGDQPWSARPAHDCDRMSITAALSQDATTMTWDLPDTFKPEGSAIYDVLLLPVGGDGNPFQTIFEKPAADAFTVTSPPPEEPVFEDIPLPDSLPPSIDDFSSDGFAVDAVPAGATGTTPLSPTTTSAHPTKGPVGALTRALENPTTRRIATLALLALGAYAYWQSNQQRAPRLLGAMSSPGNIVASAIARPVLDRPRGIGRFQRARTAPPSKL